MEAKELIGLDVAEKEWTNFLIDNEADTLIPDPDKKDSPDKEDREDYQSKKANFDKAVKAISKGIISIDDDIITQKLRYPIEKASGEVLYSKLEYNQRWTAKDRQEIYKGRDPHKPDEAMAIQQKLLSKLTDIDYIVLGKLDIRDQKLTDVIISVFFL